MSPTAKKKQKAEQKAGQNMPDKSSLFIGAMSGTSLDGIDVALFELNNEQQSSAFTAKTLAHHNLAYDDEMRSQLRELCEAPMIAPQQLMELDALLGALTAQCVQQLLEKCKLGAETIGAIGSHGQTIRHLPPRDNTSRGMTWQIGDPNTIAAHTGIPVVADFRRANMAHHGQGAPLAPAFHAAAFGTTVNASETVAVVNIGGMANVSVLQSGRVVCGFDTGPGNVLMDAWTQRHKGQAFDANGGWAAEGRSDEELLEQLLKHDFLSTAAPKSTGREAFNSQWLDQQLTLSGPAREAADVQATLLEFTARTISDALRSEWSIKELYVCGGGARNGQLMKALATSLPDTRVSTTDTLGIDPQLVECAAFAWFAQQTLHAQTVASRDFTGSRQDSVLGGIFYG